MRTLTEACWSLLVSRDYGFNSLSSLERHLVAMTIVVSGMAIQQSNIATGATGIRNNSKEDVDSQKQLKYAKKAATGNHLRFQFKYLFDIWNFVFNVEHCEIKESSSVI